MPGPAPSRNVRRRNARPDWRRLPSTGRTGVPPDWPLPGRGTRAELALWGELWCSPQAVAWEALGWVRGVARYARCVVRAENRRTATAALLAEVRQLEDRLGLNPLAMKRLMWEINDEPASGAGPSTDDILDLDAWRARLG